MGSDTATVNGCGPREAGRKKKTHRSARLKQCKRDARREQWLSQVNRGECKETNEHMSPSPPSSPSISIPQAYKQQACGNGSETRKIGNGSHRSRANQAYSPGVPIDILRNSSWGGSLEKDCPANSFGGRSSSNSSCWRSDPEDDRDVDVESGGGEEASLDDWEAFADSLTTTTATNNNDDSSKHSPRQGSNNSTESTGLLLPAMLHNNAGRGILKTPEPNKMVPRAWRPDDASRPQSLPNLSKQRNYYPVDLQQQQRRHCMVGTLERTRGSCIFQPLSCPICCEDLDVTDSSFLPCSCGFRLCLFCHKRILEADSRCPGCRKEYTPPVVAGGGEVLVKGAAASPLFPVKSRNSMSPRY